MKRVLSVVLALAMVFSMLTVSAFAAKADRYSDVDSSDWFYDSVVYVTDKGIMNGTSLITFSPDTITTRGMIITMLYRLDLAGTTGEPTDDPTDEPVVDPEDPGTDDPTSGGSTTGGSTTGGSTTGDPTTGDPTTGDPTTGDPTTGDPTTGDPTTGDPTTGDTTTGDTTTGPGETGDKETLPKGEVAVYAVTSFSDVDSTKYYAVPIAWAVQNGIAKGITEDLFKPDQTVTREQLATFLYRYAEYKGYDVSVGESTNILSFGDAETVSEYAVPAMQWAVGAGIINGIDGNLKPQNGGTRAQVATMFMRFIENVAH